MWAGQALALDEIDFAMRDWVRHSGWPVSLAQLQPYYRRAERLMRLPEVTYDERAWPAGLPMPPSSGGMRRRFSTFSPVPNFASSHRAALSRATNVIVLLHANATSLSLGEDGTTVERVAIASLGGRIGLIRASMYVICCGWCRNAETAVGLEGFEDAGRRQRSRPRRSLLPGARSRQGARRARQSASDRPTVSQQTARWDPLLRQAECQPGASAQRADPQCRREPQL